MRDLNERWKMRLRKKEENDFFFSLFCRNLELQKGESIRTCFQLGLLYCLQFSQVRSHSDVIILDEFLKFPPLVPKLRRRNTLTAILPTNIYRNSYFINVIKLVEGPGNLIYHHVTQIHYNFLELRKITDSTSKR